VGSITERLAGGVDLTVAGERHTVPKCHSGLSESLDI
jgi:hypothetical protein